MRPVNIQEEINRVRAKIEVEQREDPLLKFKRFARKDGIILMFNDLTLRSFRQADDKIGLACFYGNTTGEDALFRGKVGTIDDAVAWIDANPMVTPA